MPPFAPPLALLSRRQQRPEDASIETARSGAMDEVKITPAMIAAGADALALAGDTAAETMVEIITKR